MGIPLDIYQVDRSGTCVRVAGVGGVVAIGTTVPTAGTPGYAKGGLFINNSTGIPYKNSGTFTSCSFAAMFSADESVSATDLVLNSTNKMNVKFGGVTALAIDDATIAGNVAAANTAASSIYLASQSGGVATSAGKSGGSISIVAGNGSNAAGGSNGNGGDGGSILLNPGTAGVLDGIGSDGASGLVWVSGALRACPVATEAASILGIYTSGTVAVAVPTIANDTAENGDSVDVSVSSMTFSPAVGDAVIAVPLEALPTDCLLCGAYVVGTDSVRVTFMSKEGGGGVTGANKNFAFIFIDLT